jgi:hypothetical protein
MYSISVLLSRSIILTQRSVTADDDDDNGDDNKSNPREYLIVEADYDPVLGLLVDTCFFLC